MKRLQTSQMQALVEFVEAGSLEKAAQKLHITQPALSIQIKKIESEFKYPLFAVQGKRKVLTPYGRALFETSKNLLGQIDSALERIERVFADPKNQTLRIAGRRELFQFFAQKIQPPCRFQFIPSSSEQSVKMLLNQDIDLAISRIVPNLSEIRSIKLLSNKPHLVCHEKYLQPFKRHRIEENKNFLIKTPVMIYNPTAPLLSSWLQKIEISLNDLNIKYICDDWLSILDLVETGHGYSVIPNSLIPKSNKIITVELPDSVMPTFDFFILFRKNNMKLPVFKELFGSKNEWSS